MRAIFRRLIFWILVYFLIKFQIFDLLGFSIMLQLLFLLMMHRIKSMYGEYLYDLVCLLLLLIHEYIDL